MAAKKPKSPKSKKPTPRSESSRSPTRKKAAARAEAPPPAVAPDGDVPDLFRVTLECNNLGRATEFYDALLDQRGVRHPGSRVYYRCGGVTLQVVDVSADRDPRGNGDALYFAVRDLALVHLRARELGCLSVASVHGVPAGDVAKRPWGERSFYAEDPWRNELCFVEVGTEYSR